MFIPGYLLPIYVLLLVAIGWFSGQLWRNNEAHAAPALTQVAPPAAPQTTAVTQTVAKATIEPVHNADKTEKPAKPAKPIAPQKSINPLPSDELAPFKYSAHVYSTEDDERSITLNGQRYQEGESPAPNLTIEQIQQDATVFNFNGEVFTLTALEDWPGGKVDKANLTEDASE
ncbi:general secretion pathway protein GspB [Serratia sp. S1B]|nr:general secretion pathway protein GspB [Serratia sp. S1B]